MGMNVGYLTAGRGPESDECMTPFYACEPLLKYVPKDWTIWCPGASQVGYQNKSVDNNTFNIYTTYNLQLGAEKEHAFKFMVGMNRVTSKWSSHKGWKTNLIDLTNPQFPLASGDQFIEGDRNWEAQLGFFGRLNYSFEDRYFLEANIRRDGSSKFPKNLQWRWFPSFSAGWVFTNESFMKPVENILSFGKFRSGDDGKRRSPNLLPRRCPYS